MQKRVLGNTGEQLSVIGFGGIVVMDVPASEAADSVARAVELGINYFDVAPYYGNAQQMLGPALKPYRDKAFLACKTELWDGKAATEALHDSLRKLETDHFDLYQLHAVESDEDVDEILAPGGALEAFIAAREAGKIRHIGFSAHSERAALRLFEAFEFESILLPVNLYCWEEGKFGPGAVQRARDAGAGVLALKALSERPWREGEVKSWPKCWYKPVDTLGAAKAGLAFTLSQPGVTAAVSPSHAELLWLMCEALEALGEGPWDASAWAGAKGEAIFQTA